MTPEHWLAVLGRIAPTDVIDLDAGAAPGAAPGTAPGAAPGTAPGTAEDGAPRRAGQGIAAWDPASPPPSARLWDRADSGVTWIGVRVDAPLADPAGAALRLAAAALERGVTPVILTSRDATGFERFGFRVERFVPGAGADRAAWEAEITAFWSLALVIDAADVAALG